MGLPWTEYASEMEARIEKVIYACRFMTFLAIGGSLVGSVPCFLKGCVYVMDAFIEYYLHGGGKVTLMLVEAIDMFLIGTVMFVFGTGLYERKFPCPELLSLPRRHVVIAHVNRQAGITYADGMPHDPTTCSGHPDTSKNLQHCTDQSCCTKGSLMSHDSSDQ